MLKSLFLVETVVFCGSICRYLTGIYFSNLYPNAQPWGTFIVNVVGCFLVGAFYSFSKQYEWFGAHLSLLLIIGFCGGFTTRSEEHTSELKSRGHLLCRLLLRKKSVISDSYSSF